MAFLAAAVRSLFIRNNTAIGGINRVRQRVIRPSRPERFGAA